MAAQVAALHSTMFLLIHLRRTEWSVWLQSLHSTMFLLILDVKENNKYIISFTFHDVSINTFFNWFCFLFCFSFTFHDVSINTALLSFLIYPLFFRPFFHPYFFYFFIMCDLSQICRGHPPVSGRPPKIANFSTGGISPSVPLSAVPASVVFCNHALLHGTHGKGL